jgi:hypothetical protein
MPTATTQPLPLNATAGAHAALRLVRGFRVALVGTCLAGCALGWIVGSQALLGLSIVVLAEELLETSVVAGALRRQLAGAPTAPRRWPGR